LLRSLLEFWKRLLAYALIAKRLHIVIVIKRDEAGA
jgi:hypothetical protein